MSLFVTISRIADGITCHRQLRNVRKLITIGLPPKAEWEEWSMKLLSFVAGGKDFFGAVSGDGVVTLNDRIGEPDLRAALAAGKMAAMRGAAKLQKPDRKLGDIEFAPVNPLPANILCAGFNYRSHAA